MHPTTFIHTNSLDLTADLVISLMPADAVFRYNIDLWRDYTLHVDAAGFFLKNPAGRSLRSSDIAKVYWRRPFTSERLYPERTVPDETRYVEEELGYAVRDMINLLWAEGKVVLVEPLADLRIGKFVQLRVAAKYFTVPAYKFVLRSSDVFARGKTSVVKSLTSRRIDGSKVIYTTPVQEERLDPAVPWMIQDYVEASRDVTVVFVRGRLHAFELDRTRFIDKTVDWREMGPDGVTDAWNRHSLPKDVERNVSSFMADLNLHYGRLDFLLAGETYCFLEVNANGEWAWLDFEGSHGLRGTIIEELLPTTPCHSIPLPRHIRF